MKRIYLMASGRVGGTKSKVSGSVGSEVYSLRRNADGSYSQIIASKPDQIRYSNTEKQAAQRMATAMVEVMMRDLTPVAKISFQSGVNKSKSLNAFSSMNLMRIREDMQANWYGGNRYVYPVKGGDISQGGTYLISSGTLQRLPYENKELVHCTPSSWNCGVNDIGKPAIAFAGFRFEGGVRYHTFGEFLDSMKISRSDTFVTVIFREFHSWNPETESDDISYGYQYSIAKIKANISDNTIIPGKGVREIFDISTNGDAVGVLNQVYNRTHIGLIIPESCPDDMIYYWGCFAISYRNGYRQVQHCELVNDSGSSEPWLIHHAPTNVFWSWIENGTIGDLPSPWE